MNPSKSSNSSEPTSFKNDQAEFEQAFEEVESLLQNLKERYLQIQIAKQRRTELQQRLHELQAELRQVKETLEALEVDLESRLFSWNSQREVFWQVIRFVGLGIVVGLAFKACTN
jgi:chromosome segregation ATPase